MSEEQLQSIAQHPAHALLLAGSTASEAATELAGKLLRVADPASYPYYRQVAPDEKGTISIEAVRTLIEFFQLKVPGTASIRRVAVIRDAENMGTEAQNALLKLLEEPPADSVLVLATGRPQNLLGTIRSRVQQTVLHEQAAAPPEAESLQLVKQALGSGSYDRLLMVDGALKAKETATQFVATLTTVAEASLVASARRQSGTLDRWHKVLQAASVAENALAHNGNQKLVLTELMLSM